jgi:hypothetical protein
MTTRIAFLPGSSGATAPSLPHKPPPGSLGSGCLFLCGVLADEYDDSQELGGGGKLK